MNQLVSHLLTLVPIVSLSCGGQTLIEPVPSEPNSTDGKPDAFLAADAGGLDAGGFDAVVSRDAWSQEGASMDAYAFDASRLEGGSRDTGPDGLDLFDVIPPLPDGSVASDCVACLQTRCGDSVNACYNDPTCVSGVQCAVLKCLDSSGQPDITCVLECFNNDMSSAMRAMTLFQCVSESCSEDCRLSDLAGSVP